MKSRPLTIAFAASEIESISEEGRPAPNPWPEQSSSRVNAETPLCWRGVDSAPKGGFGISGWATQTLGFNR